MQKGKCLGASWKTVSLLTVGGTIHSDSAPTMKGDEYTASFSFLLDVSMTTSAPFFFNEALIQQGT